MTKNLVVLVTAGANGIGLAIARKFLAEGFAVHVCDIDPEALDCLPVTLPGATASLTDVADSQKVDALFETVSQRYGRLDVLVNSAGIAGPVAKLEDIQPEDWDSTLAVDLNSVFYVCRLAIPLLRKTGGGSIINIASTAVLFGCPMRAPYVASKWGVIGLTKTLAMELGEDQIRVNAICPGSVNGPRIEGVMANAAEKQGKTIEEIRQAWTQQISMRRFVDVEDVVAMAWFLVSIEGRYISGQAMTIDGHTESLSSPIE